MLISVTPHAPVRHVFRPSSPGNALAGRRRTLGLSQEDLLDAVGHYTNEQGEQRWIIPLKRLSMIENDHMSARDDLSVNQFYRLLIALQWSPEEAEHQLGAPIVTTDPFLENTRPFAPTLDVPIVGAVQAGDTAQGQSFEGDDVEYLSVDRNLKPLAGANQKMLRAMLVNGDSMVSDYASRLVMPGSHIVVEVGAQPVDGNLVVAWLPNRNVAVLKQYRESGETILRSYRPGGPVFRLASEPFEIRGVVRIIQLYP